MTWDGFARKENGRDKSRSDVLSCLCPSLLFPISAWQKKLFNWFLALISCLTLIMATYHEPHTLYSERPTRDQVSLLLFLVRHVKVIFCVLKKWILIKSANLKGIIKVKKVKVTTPKEANNKYWKYSQHQL